MTLEEKKNLLVKMGLQEETAEYYLKDESNKRAVLPAFRLLKPLITESFISNKKLVLHV